MKEREDQLKPLQIMAAAVMTGIVVFSVIAYIINLQSGNLMQEFPKTEWVMYGLLAITVIVLFILRYQYDVKWNALVEDSLRGEEKLEKFRSLLLMHYLVCEVPALVAVVCFLLSGYPGFFLIPALVLMEMIRKFPTAYKLEQLQSQF